MDDGSPVDGSPVDAVSPDGDTTDSTAVLPEAAKGSEAAGGSQDPPEKKPKKEKKKKKKKTKKSAEVKRQELESSDTGAAEGTDVDIVGLPSSEPVIKEEIGTAQPKVEASSIPVSDQPAVAESTDISPDPPVSEESRDTAPDQPVADTMEPAPSQPMEETMEPAPGQPMEETMEPVPDQSAEATMAPVPDQSAEATMAPAPDQSAEATMAPAPDQSSEDTLEPAPDQSSDDTMEPAPSQPMEETKAPAPDQSSVDTLEPATEQSSEDTLEPAPDQSSDDTLEPAPDQSSEATMEPAPDQSSEATMEPAPDQSSEATMEPAPDQSSEATMEPATDQSAEETMEPAPVEAANEEPIQPVDEAVAEEPTQSTEEAVDYTEDQASHDAVDEGPTAAVTETVLSLETSHPDPSTTGIPTIEVTEHVLGDTPVTEEPSEPGPPPYMYEDIIKHDTSAEMECSAEDIIDQPVTPTPQDESAISEENLLVEEINIDPSEEIITDTSTTGLIQAETNLETSTDTSTAGLVQAAVYTDDTEDLINDSDVAEEDQDTTYEPLDTSQDQFMSTDISTIPGIQDQSLVSMDTSLEGMFPPLDDHSNLHSSFLVMADDDNTIGQDHQLAGSDATSYYSLPHGRAREDFQDSIDTDSPQSSGDHMIQGSRQLHPMHSQDLSEIASPRSQISDIIELGPNLIDHYKRNNQSDETPSEDTEDIIEDVIEHNFSHSSTESIIKVVTAEDGVRKSRENMSSFMITTDSTVLGTTGVVMSREETDQTTLVDSYTAQDGFKLDCDKDSIATDDMLGPEFNTNTMLDDLTSPVVTPRETLKPVKKEQMVKPYTYSPNRDTNMSRLPQELTRDRHEDTKSNTIKFRESDISRLELTGGEFDPEILAEMESFNEFSSDWRKETDISKHETTLKLTKTHEKSPVIKDTSFYKPEKKLMADIHLPKRIHIEGLTDDTTPADGQEEVEEEKPVYKLPAHYERTPIDTQASSRGYKSYTQASSGGYKSYTQESSGGYKSYTQESRGGYKSHTDNMEDDQASVDYKVEDHQTNGTSNIWYNDTTTETRKIHGHTGEIGHTEVIGHIEVKRHIEGHPDAQGQTYTGIKSINREFTTTREEQSSRRDEASEDDIGYYTSMESPMVSSMHKITTPRKSAQARELDSIMQDAMDNAFSDRSIPGGVGETEDQVDTYADLMPKQLLKSSVTPVNVTRTYIQVPAIKVCLSYVQQIDFLVINFRIHTTVSNIHVKKIHYIFSPHEQICI